jgi:hypothetical protein
MDGFVIPAQAGIQYYRGVRWIPALRFDGAGMTKQFTGILYKEQSLIHGFVIPAKAGIQASLNWTPGFAGVTSLLQLI